MKSDRRRICLLTAGAFLLLAIIYAVTANKAYQRDHAHAIRQAELSAKVYTVELERDFHQGIAIAKVLEDVIRNGQGRIEDFPSIAEDLVQDYVDSVQLAPNGVVTDIYPMEGNEAGRIDLLRDPERGPVAAYGIEHDVVTMQGPFALRQGGMGIAVRDPVFLTDAQGNRTFWGFTVVIIKATDMLRFSMDSLKSLGYDYILSTTGSPVSDEFKVVAASADSLIRPVASTIREGECDWKLEITPENGWRISTESLITSIVGAIFVLLITVTLAVLLMLNSQKRQLRVMAETDPLTGLLNRKGRVERVEKYLAANPGGTATEVFLDIDDFKIINDLYGHDIGDEALKNLAKNLEKVFRGAAVVSRTGGDEFGVFLQGMTAEQAEPLIFAASDMDQTFTTAQGKKYTYTISMGYADYPAQAATREELARNVDSALYNVKLNGKHGCQRYVPGMYKQSRQQFGFSQKELLDTLPGAEFICDVENANILYVNDDLIHLFECDNLEDFTRFSLGMLRNMICPDDYERLLTALREKLAGKTNVDHVCEHFGIVTKTSGTKSVLAQVRAQHHEVFGDLYYITAMDLEEADGAEPAEGKETEPNAETTGKRGL